MRKRVFGFDLGIASIGWAAVEFSDEDFDPETGEVIDGKILKSGVRCFPVAEDPQSGTSLAEPRRSKRLARRTCRRKARRMEAIKKLFVARGLINNFEQDLCNQTASIYARQIGGDVWQLRIKALSQPLNNIELVRVLTHLAKHRGFQSYRKAVEEADAEGGKVLKAIKDNKELLSDNKTLAQIIVEQAGEHGKKRNYTQNIIVKGKETQESVYINSIPRDEIKRETDLIFKAQEQYGLFSQNLYNDFTKIAFRYRPVGSIAKMVGYCRFEKGEKRAPKEAPTSELFVALSKINNMSFLDANGKIRGVTPDERQKILDLLKTTKTVKYSSLSKKILEGKVRFKDINYSKTQTKDKKGNIKEINPEDVIFYEMKGWHKLKSAFSAEEWAELQKDIPLLDKVVTIIACEKNDKNISEALKKLGLSEDYIKKFNSLTFKEFINLSLKALYKIVPSMQDGDVYSVACEKVGYDPQGMDKLVQKKGILLPVIPDNKLTTVPVVNRTVAQFRKVYNAMVRQFGVPDQINIETGRELKKTFEERREIKNKNEENRKEREATSAKLSKNNVDSNAQNILKYRLYMEQSGKCIYSGKTIDLQRLDENGYLDVDHILPYSRSLDNSYNNKVLCLSEENRKKGNKTPFEYIMPADWAEFEARVKTLHNGKKAEKLLTKNFVDRELEFRDRNANDNNHISRYVKQYCEDALDFSQSQCPDIKNRIQMRTGSLTDYLRHQWGLVKDRNENDRHHAQDAIVIACATQGMVKRLSSLSAIFENKYEYQERKRKELGEDKAKAWYTYIKKQMQEPWIGFRNDVLASLDEIFVSRPPRKSATGQVHKDTIYTLNPQKKNYNAQNIKSGIPVRGGLSGNGDMLRIDIFAKKNPKGKEEFYLVPVYLANMGKELPNKAAVSGKEEKDWLIIDETYNFKFSLYSDDLIKITQGDEVIFGYYKGADRASARIKIESHDRASSARKCIKTLDKIQKYTVDVLGNYNEIKSEKRLPLTDIKSGSQRQKDRAQKQNQNSDKE